MLRNMIVWVYDLVRAVSVGIMRGELRQRICVAVTAEDAR